MFAEVWQMRAKCAVKAREERTKGRRSARVKKLTGYLL